MAIVDINNNVLYNPVRPAFWEVDSSDPSPYFYKGVNVPCSNTVMTTTTTQQH